VHLLPPPLCVVFPPEPPATVAAPTVRGLDDLYAERSRLQHDALAESTHKTYEHGVRSFREFCVRRQLQDPVADADTVTLWITDLTKTRVAPGTLNTYVSAIKKAIENEELPGDLHGIHSSTLLRDILKGYARTYTPPPSDRSISAPFKVDDFKSMVQVYELSCLSSSGPPRYKDTLVLAGMALGLGGCLRPGEYLKTGPCQRDQAILTIQQLRFHLVNKRIPLPGEAVQSTLQDNNDFAAPDRLLLRSAEILLQCSKTDQTKKGYMVPITDPICVRLIAEYLIVRPRIDSAGQTLNPLLLDIIDGLPQHCTAQHFTTYMRDFMSRHGVPRPHDFSLKSLRSGAVESLAKGEARKLKDKVIAKGRWTNFNTPEGSYLNRPTSW
jgi:hypothetical protein